MEKRCFFGEVGARTGMGEKVTYSSLLVRVLTTKAGLQRRKLVKTQQGHLSPVTPLAARPPCLSIGKSGVIWPHEELQHCLLLYHLFWLAEAR